MKKKFLVSFFAAFAATTLVLGFSACETESSSGIIPGTSGGIEQPTPDPYPEASPETDFKYTIKNDCVTITKYLNKTATSVVIPETIEGKPVTAIDESAFFDCDKKSLEGDSPKSLENLTSITIPKSVTSISQRAFLCSSLKEVYVAEENPAYYSKNNYLIEKASKTLILGCKNSVIPADGSVTAIGDAAFTLCTSLTSVTIPDSIISIGDYSFAYCSSLISVIIGNGTQTIGGFAFV